MSKENVHLRKTSDPFVMVVCAHFFWCEVVRRVQRKAPTTTTIMVNAPTEMMMTMTRIWLSPLPAIPGLPTQRHGRATVNLLHHCKAGVCLCVSVCVCVCVYYQDLNKLRLYTSPYCVQDLRADSKDLKKSGHYQLETQDHGLEVDGCCLVLVAN